MTILRISFFKLALAAASAILFASAALAANPRAVAEAQARYRQDLAACHSGQSSQDRATCLREARNALAEARRGGLNDAPGQYQQNALRRCGAHQGDDRADCEARMRGEGSSEGSSEGSVGGGGILRQSVTVVPSK